MNRKIVVIGAGQAAIAFAAKLRELDKQCDITLIGSEPSLPYQRPPLSKKYMTGEMEAERLLLRPANWYEESNVTCLTKRTVTEISPGDKTVKLDSDDVLAFDKLLIATGSTPRKLPEKIGGNLQGVHTLRNFADADAISMEMISGRHILIIGGGYIGLETASVAASRGLKVTVVEMADRILNRVASEDTARFIRELHRSHGVDIREGVLVSKLLEEDGRVNGVELGDGTTLPVDFVVAGIGITPDIDLAQAAGIETDNGIVVDASTRTSNPDIHAAGDCASFKFRGVRIRLESVQNAIDQAEAAAHVVAGAEVTYNPVPWFWSDQYDCKLQIAGFNMGYESTVVRPGSREGSHSIWYFDSGNFIAVDAINDPKPYMFGKKLLELGRDITREQAANPEFELKTLIR
ncbi:MAG: NAD(P)/FAD-dependent oxidoreductase [Rhizobiaceae bacterium]